MNEIWKEYIYNFDVSNKGRIRNRVTGHILKQTPFKNGYYGCVVSCGSRLNKKAIRIHVAVAELFIENPFAYTELNHKDGNKLNNEVDNLEWCTHSYNIEHAINKGLLKISQGEDHGLAKLKREDVEFIRTHYTPYDNQYGARALARKYGVHHSVIERIVHNKAWWSNPKGKG